MSEQNHRYMNYQVFGYSNVYPQGYIYNFPVEIPYVHCYPNYALNSMNNGYIYANMPLNNNSLSQVENNNHIQNFKRVNKDIYLKRRRNINIKRPKDKNKNKLNYCNVCDKGFISLEKYNSHVEEDHIICNEKNCNYSAPLEILQYHKLKHIKNAKGQSIVDSPEEVSKWVEARKLLYPYSSSRNNTVIVSTEGKMVPIVHSNVENKNQLKTMSALERLLRSKIVNPNNEILKFEPIRSAFYPAIEKILKPHVNENKLNSTCTKCRPTKNKRSAKCKCKDKHQDKKKLLINGGYRQPLLLKLLAPEIQRYEAKLLAAINYIVEDLYSNSKM
ncbi:hypothetical protein cand_000550 [Cryptosporidium andersoni]|uniref:C2H2-type domain-containing protein n=1 Tax=Cryptosporidium andersoni TaxID=117008 RepID=A0A1J4MQT1_9CRYT|nr:hypothetical protein cand_000550 [Cryptosporidium andersoni]